MVTSDLFIATGVDVELQFQRNNSKKLSWVVVCARAYFSHERVRCNSSHIQKTKKFTHTFQANENVACDVAVSTLTLLTKAPRSKRREVFFVDFRQLKNRLCCYYIKTLPRCNLVILANMISPFFMCFALKRAWVADYDLGLWALGQDGNLGPRALVPRVLYWRFGAWTPKHKC